MQRLNQLLPEINEVKIKNWLATLDLAIGIIHQNSVHLANLGSIEAWLIHHNKLTTILEKTTKLNPIKIFSDIVSGELKKKMFW